MKKSPRFRQSLIALLTSFICVIAIAQEATPLAAPQATVAPQAAGPIDCVEVELFKVSEEKVEGQTERAEKIPVKNLEVIRDALVQRIPRNAKNVSSVALGKFGCPNPATAAVLSGDILDFRKGNTALRFFIGFGAGAQKVRVRLTLTTKSSGDVIAQEEIADTKWSGVFNYSNTKGLNDFAEKAAVTTARILKKH